MGQKHSPAELILASLSDAGYQISRREVGPWIVLHAVPTDGGEPLHAADRDENAAAADLMSAARAAALGASLADLSATGRLSDQTWVLVQASVPIVCVDLAPLALGRDGAIERIGLIRRQVPQAGERWALVGGRLWRDETLAQGLVRQVRETLGERAQVRLPAVLRPLVAEYARGQFADRPSDPRQHSIGLTFGLEISGRISPSGEAIGFRWFALDDLPPRLEFGFGQGLVLADLLDSLDEPDAARRLRAN